MCWGLEERFAARRVAFLEDFRRMSVVSVIRVIQCMAPPCVSEPFIHLIAAAGRDAEPEGARRRAVGGVPGRPGRGVRNFHITYFQSDFVRPVLQPVKVLSPEERGAARWAAFLEDPDAWLDQRPAKAAGQLGSRHPDFVHSADKRRSLWLDSHTTPPEVHKVRRPMTADC